MDQATTIDLERYRKKLQAIAYNMLGDWQEAKDIVQDTYVSWLEKQPEAQNPEAYLSRMVVNKSINRLEELKKTREQYTGTWLPVPIIEERLPDAPEQPQDILSFAVLHLMEKLNALERSVLILREAFDYSYAEIAEFCGLSEDNCRQLLHRAKERLQLSKVRFEPDHEQHTRLLNAFVTACAAADTEKLAEVLKADIQLLSDGGGKRSAALHIVHGAHNVSKFMLGILRKQLDISVRSVYINGLPGLLFITQADGEIDCVMMIDAEGGQIRKLFIVRNPDKLFLP